MGAEVHNLKVGDKVWFVVPYCVQGEDTFAKKIKNVHFTFCRISVKLSGFGEGICQKTSR